MKKSFRTSSRGVFAFLFCVAAAGFVLPLQAAPKRVLVVSTTMVFYHTSIPTSERVIKELGEKSGATSQTATIK